MDTWGVMPNKMNGTGDIEGCNSENSAMNPQEAISTHGMGAARRSPGQLHCAVEDLTKDNALNHITARSFRSVGASLGDCSSRPQLLSSSVGRRLPYHWEHEKYNRIVSEKNSMRYDVEFCADDSGNDDDIDTADCSADDDDDICHVSPVNCNQVENMWPKTTVTREAEIVSISNNCDSSSAEVWKQPEFDEFYCDLRESIDEIRNRNSRLYDESHGVIDSDDKIHGTWDSIATNRNCNNQLYDESHDVVGSTDDEDNENSCNLDLNSTRAVGYSKFSLTPAEQLLNLHSKSMPSSSPFEMENGSSVSFVSQREYQRPTSDMPQQVRSEWSTGPQIISESGLLSKHAAHFDDFDTSSSGQTQTNSNRSSENHYRAEGSATNLELGAARSHIRSSHVVSDGSIWNHCRRKNFADGLDSAGNSPKDDDDDDSDDEVHASQSNFVYHKEIKSGIKFDSTFMQRFAKEPSLAGPESNGMYPVGRGGLSESAAASIGRAMYPRCDDNHLDQTRELHTESKAMSSQKDEQRLRMMRRRRERRENAASAGLSQSNAVEGYVGDKELSVDELVSYIDSQAGNNLEKHDKKLTGRRKSKKKKKSAGEKPLVHCWNDESHVSDGETWQLRTKADAMSMDDQDVGKSGAQINDHKVDDFNKSYQTSIVLSSGEPIEKWHGINLNTGLDSVAFKFDGGEEVACRVHLRDKDLAHWVDSSSALSEDLSASSISHKNLVFDEQFEILAACGNSENQVLEAPVVEECQRLDNPVDEFSKRPLLYGNGLPTSNLVGTSTPTSSISDARESLDLDFRSFADDTLFPVESVVDNFADDHNFTIVQKKKRKAIAQSSERNPVRESKLSNQKLRSPQENLLASSSRRNALPLKPGVSSSSCPSRSTLSSGGCNVHEETEQSMSGVKPAKRCTASESLGPAGAARALPGLELIQSTATQINYVMTTAAAGVTQSEDRVVLTASNSIVLPDSKPELNKKADVRHLRAGVGTAAESMKSLNICKNADSDAVVGLIAKPADHLLDNCIAINGSSLERKLICDDSKNAIAADKNVFEAFADGDALKTAQCSQKHGYSGNVKKCNVSSKKAVSSHASSNRGSCFLDTRQPSVVLNRDEPMIVFGFNEDADQLSSTVVAFEVPSSYEVENVLPGHEKSTDPTPITPSFEGVGFSLDMNCMKLDVETCNEKPTQMSEVSANLLFAPKEKGCSSKVLCSEANGNSSETVVLVTNGSSALPPTLKAQLGPQALSQSSSIQFNLHSTQLFLFRAFEETLSAKSGGPGCVVVYSDTAEVVSDLP